MTDGPFKNQKLSRCWRRLAESVQNDAVDRAECGALASDAIVRELLTDNMRDLLGTLQKYASRDQLDLNPLSAVASIFDNHGKAPFADKLNKELAFRLGNQIPFEVALGQALETSVTGQSNEARNHFVEEYIRARDTRKIDPEQCKRAIDKIHASFDAIDSNRICEALVAGNKNAFKEAVRKKEGLDEGPNL